MNGRLVATTVTLLTLAALTFGSASLAAGRSAPNVIIGTRSIDGYRVGAGYAQARRLFGFPSSSTQSSRTCTARWANGVTIVWHRNFPYSKWARACVRFNRALVGGASVAGPIWRTDKGLRVKDSQKQIKKLYPSATSTRSSGYTVWTLSKASGTSLEAWVKNGRVAFFRLAAS